MTLTPGGYKILSKCDNLSKYIYQSLINYFKNAFQNTQNYKWYLLVFLFIIVDGVTTYVGLKYEYMVEINPIMIYLIKIFNLDFAIMVLLYIKYIVIVVLYEFFKVVPSPYNWAAFYTIFAMSTFIAVNNTLLIIWAVFT